jgi:stage V sporulation protein AD
MQKNMITLKKPVSIFSCACVGGHEEKAGPLGEYFDAHDKKDKFGQKTWEQAESEMQHMALNLALAKKKASPYDMDALFAGDLLNQCVGSAYGLLSFDIPFFGLYGACSTAVEGLILASLLISSDIYQRAAVVASSHYCSSERQFRFPLEYGGQRTPTSQWTVTGSGAFLLGTEEDSVEITEALVGRSIDYGITDANNMGAAMAPAAIDTLTRYFQSSQNAPSDFDLIATGDLGYEGHRIVKEQLMGQGLNLGDRYTDCGLMIYDREKQDKHAGGSGCGCSATVLAGYLYSQLQSGALQNILLIGTGALMSPTAVQQGNSIPGIAHLIHLRAPKSKRRDC